MLKYKVVRDCHGFKGRYWTEGEIVDLPEGDNPPRHFVLLSDLGAENPKKAKHDPQRPKQTATSGDGEMPLSALTNARAKPEGGFASSISSAQPKMPNTAGKVLANDKGVNKRGRRKASPFSNSGKTDSGVQDGPGLKESESSGGQTPSN